MAETPESVITDEVKAMIGVEGEPSKIEVEKGAIRRYAQAIGDPNPLYSDEEFAKKTKYGGIIPPPGFTGWSIRSGRPAPRPRLFDRSFNGGNEFEFIKPIHPGDELTAVSRLVDVQQRQGGPRTGRMVILTSETVYTNQRGEVVMKGRGSQLQVEGPQAQNKEG